MAPFHICNFVEYVPENAPEDYRAKKFEDLLSQFKNFFDERSKIPPEEVASFYMPGIMMVGIKTKNPSLGVRDLLEIIGSKIQQDQDTEEQIRDKITNC